MLKIVELRAGPISSRRGGEGRMEEDWRWLWEEGRGEEDG